ncbi:MAG TPA: hypothetical protein PLO24_13380, partial [Bacteroidales bacterium]|nr:hypothetical protein [Bacteroidales bacterium]
MDETRTNIDLVFRNGLKNYEVLPPPEAWNNIRPAIRARQRPLIILRAAASAAVLLSVAFLAYRLSTRITMPEQTVISGLPEGIPPALVIAPGEVQVVAEKNVPPERQIIAEADSDVPGEMEVIPGAADDNLIIQPVETSQTASGVVFPARHGRKDFSLRELFRSDRVEIAAADAEPFYFPDASESGKKTGKWRISALVSPTYYTSFYSGNDEFVSRLMTDEQPGFSYSGGLALAYRVSKRVSVQSGLYFSSFGQELAGITSFAGFQPYDYA